MQLLTADRLQVDPAGFELAGHLILKRQVDYDEVDQEWVWKLLSHASVSEPDFEAIVELVVADEAPAAS